MYSSASEGSVEVDSNQGTVAELQAELATETPAERSTGRLTVPNTAQADGDDGSLEEPAAGATAGDEAASAAGKTLARKKGSYQARLDAITAERHATAAERDAAQAEAASLRTKLAALEGKPAEKPAEKPAPKVGVGLDADKFPKYAEWMATAPDDANDLEDWVEARDTWKADKAGARMREARALEASSAKHVALAKTFAERMAPVLKADPKFYDTQRIDPRLLETPAISALRPGQQPHLGNFLVEQVLKSEHPHELLIYLSDPATIQRLGTLQPDDILRDLAKKELSIRPLTDGTGPVDEEQDADDDQPVRTRRGSSPQVPAATSQASAPPKPVRGSSQQSADHEPGDDASDDEWLRAETRKARRRH